VTGTTNNRTSNHFDSFKLIFKFSTCTTPSVLSYYLLVVVPIIDQRNALLSIHNRPSKSPSFKSARAGVAPRNASAVSLASHASAPSISPDVCALAANKCDVFEYWFLIYTNCFPLLLAALAVLKLAIANFRVSMYHHCVPLLITSLKNEYMKYIVLVFLICE
jgi:hypothetical protein